MDRGTVLTLLEAIRNDAEARARFLEVLIEVMSLRENRFHALVFVNGQPELGQGIYVGLFSEINARGGRVVIGDDCDIASFVSINVADSHNKCIGRSQEVERSTIVLENNVFVGSHSFIGGNTTIGHHSVVAAGTVLINGGEIPPYSLIVGNPAKIKRGFYDDPQHSS